jgi:16S rRNA (guanine966-N2)-methyltransferase
LVDIVIRVLGGVIRGRKLRGPKGLQFRPTTGRVKEFIFSFLGNEMEGVGILDLFAGSGALGIEALSRGAEKVIFVEQSFQNVNLIQANLKLCHFSDRTKVIRGDVFREIKRFGQKGEKFDLILADPPFLENERDRIVSSVDHSQILNDEGFLIIEHISGDPDFEKHHMKLLKQRHFGHCMISIYHP